MPGADGMSSKFMKNAFVGWTFTAGLYYPPDFDASKLAPIKTLRAKGQQSKGQVRNIRMMFPFTMVCDTCGEYNYTGTKFTARVEQIRHESYLGLKIYRFYGRCMHCWAEFTFKTDPKNSDYTMESGGKRTYEAWKDADMMESMMKAEKEKEAELDQMKALEQKSIDVQAEMQRLEDLEAIRTMNRRLGAREKTIDEALAMLFERDQKTEDDTFETGNREQLAAFKEAQEERKRQKLDEELESGALAEANMGVFGSSRASASSSGGAGGASAGGAPSGGAASAAGASGASAAGAAIASAVAERAAANAGKPSGVGVKLAIKRKAVADEGGDAKRPREGPAGDAGSGASAAAAPAGPAAGGLGLGSYDSDSS